MSKIKSVKYVLNNQNVKYILTLLSGSVIAQGIVFLITPILSRIYSNEMFGTFTLFSSLSLTISTVVALRYELAILLPKREKDAVSLLLLSLILITVISLIILTLVVFFHDFFNGLFKNGGLGNAIFLLPGAVFLHGIMNAFTYWLNRQKNFKNISYARINKSLTMSGVQFLTGFSALQYLGLIPGLIAGQVIAGFHFLFTSIQSVKEHAKQISFSRILYMAKKYQKIPKFNTLMTFSNTLSNELPNILIPKYFGLAVGGQFGLSIRLIKTPVALISESISQIFFNKASKTYNQNPEGLYELVKQTYLKLFYLAMAGFPFLFISTYFFEFILGSDWTEAGYYSRLLIPLLFLMFINTPITWLVVILSKQRSFVIFDLSLLLFRFGALFTGYHIFNNIIHALVLYSGVGMVFNTLMIFYFLKISKQTTQEEMI